MAQAMDKGQGKRRPVDPMRHHRENGWDYRGRAIYHFTLPVEERFPLFGTLADAPVHFARIFAGRGSIWEQARLIIMSAYCMRLGSCGG